MHELLDMARKIEGMPRHTSTHAAEMCIRDRASGGICKGAVGHKSKDLRQRQNGNPADAVSYTHLDVYKRQSHDLDCPWRPADLEQRAGRTVRQGNDNPKVGLYRYVTEGTFDKGQIGRNTVPQPSSPPT